MLEELMLKKKKKVIFSISFLFIYSLRRLFFFCKQEVIILRTFNIAAAVGLLAGST